MKATIFDIETLPLPPDQLPPFDKSQALIGNLKDPDKIRAKVEAARAEWLAGAALHPMTGMVAMVGIKEIDESPVAVSGFESDIVAWTLDVFKRTIRGGGVIVGFNCFEFDLPFLFMRGLKHGLPILHEMRKGRYWDKAIIDLREEMLFGTRNPPKGTSSLAAYAAFLGLPPKLGSGVDFAGLDLEQRKAYLTRDLEVTEALYKRLFA